MEVDAVVVGAGPAGCAAAIVLAEAGFHVVVLGRPQVAERVGESLSPAAPALLAQLGLLARFQADGHLPCHANVSVWGDAAPRWYDFLRDPRGHGFHIDRARFEACLRERAEQSGARMSGPRPVRARRDGGGWTFPASGGAGPLRARHVVDASGRAAVFARAHGARREVAWEQVALVAFLPTARAIEEAFTLVEAVEEGFWYSAPIPGGRFALALFTDAALHPRRGARDAAALGRLLARAPHTRARLAAHASELAIAPRLLDASSARLERSHGPGWIAAGDAAMSYDPVSAHGLTLALRTGIDAARALIGDAAGDAGALPRYQERLDGAFDTHCREALRLYAQERRWPEAPYWKKRHRPTDST